MPTTKRGLKKRKRPLSEDSGKAPEIEKVTIDISASVLRRLLYYCLYQTNGSIVLMRRAKQLIDILHGDSVSQSKLKQSYYLVLSAALEAIVDKAIRDRSLIISHCTDSLLSKLPEELSVSQNIV